MKTLRNLLSALILPICLLFSVSCSSCQPQKNMTKSDVAVYTQISPNFDADSAFGFVQKQVDFGPRVPETPAHSACGDYLAAKLAEYGAQVIEQKADVTHYNGQNIKIRNIIGSFQPEKEKRVLLFAHWDTRPFADQEKDVEKQRQPILGADDGASGVGVLLEIARQQQQKNTEVGIDIIFFDLEDWGQADFEENAAGDWWCVGSKYWAENPHVANYKAIYGILLDMVGAPDATFAHEGHSLQYASNVLEKVWRTAVNLGYGNFFVGRKGTYITDDHVPIIEKRNIPCIDIINLKDTDTGFAPHWHTHKDNLQNIDKRTLKAVGQTVLETIYREQ